MFYPAQTSLIPVQIALIRFWENQGGQAIFSHYPYWYLGTAPFRYLSGPILPIFASGLHKFFPNFSLFEVMWLLIGICWVIGTLGLYLLVKEMTRLRPDSLRGYGEARRVAVLAAVFYLFGPIVPFLFRFSNGLYLIAFSFLPFVLLAYLKWIKEESKKRLVIFVFWFTFLLLVDTTIIPALVLGMTAIFLAGVGWKKAEKKIRKSLWLMAGAFFIATFWYTPKYWLTLLGAPSLGGKGVLEVLGWLSKILPTVMALVMAIFSVKWFKKRDFLRDFCFYWLFIFGFLTLVRFLSDPDFWLDWTAYGVELQFGMAMLLGTWFSSVLRARQAQISNLKSQISKPKLKTLYLPLILFTFYFLLFTIIFNEYVIGTFQKDVAQSVEYRIGKQLLEIVKPPSAGSTSSLQASSGQAGERVFLSGTTAFWLNAFFDIVQVRGGVDQVSVNPAWRQATWEIRDGSAGASTDSSALSSLPKGLSRMSSPQEGKKSVEWLKELGVSYLVVHTQESEEFYHDFAYPDKFEGLKNFKKVYDQNGDRIYQVLN